MADGGVTHLAPLGEGQEAVVCLTGHAFIASRLGPNELSDLAPDGFGGALHPGILLRMAGPGGSVGSIDVTMWAEGRGGGGLEPNPELEDHPRVRYARVRRRDVQAFGGANGLFTLGVGLGGRLEMSVENAPGGPSGRGLIDQALSMAPRGEPVYAAVAPGNARSLRAFLSRGFSPIGSEVLIRLGGLGTTGQGQVI
jgi:hypothetical protein